MKLCPFDTTFRSCIAPLAEKPRLNDGDIPHRDACPTGDTGSRYRQWHVSSGRSIPAVAGSARCPEEVEHERLLADNGLRKLSILPR